MLLYAPFSGCLRDSLLEIDYLLRQIRQIAIAEESTNGTFIYHAYN